MVTTVPGVDSMSMDWIVRGQERILWLAPVMRVYNAILVNALLILGCISRRIELLQFCELEEGGNVADVLGVIHCCRSGTP